MAEYGFNRLTKELETQYLEELNNTQIGTKPNRMWDETCWWPCKAMVVHPRAGTEGFPEDADIPDPLYNIKARYDKPLGKWVITAANKVSALDKLRKQERA